MQARTSSVPLVEFFWKPVVSPEIKFELSGKESSLLCPVPCPLPVYRMTVKPLPSVTAVSSARAVPPEVAVPLDIPSIAGVWRGPCPHGPAASESVGWPAACQAPASWARTPCSHARLPRPLTVSTHQTTGRARPRCV